MAILVCVDCSKKSGDTHRIADLEEKLPSELPPPDIILSLDSPSTLDLDLALSGQTHTGYVGLGNLYPPQLEVTPVRAVSTSTEKLSAGSESEEERGEHALERETEGSGDGEILRNLRVLIVYSLRHTQSERLQFLSDFVVKLSVYQGVEPVCSDLASLDRKPSIWVRGEVPKADVVLCVCTEYFQQDWELDSTIIGALRIAIDAKIQRREEYANFATIKVNKEDERFIPDLLARNSSFMMDAELSDVARFIKRTPLCVLPHNARKLKL